MSEPAIKEAMNCEMHFTQDEKLRRKYEIQEKARRDYISMMYNIEKGREEGLDRRTKRRTGTRAASHRPVHAPKRLSL